MARMKAMEVPQRTHSGSESSEPIGPLPSTRGSTPDSSKPTRKVSFRVRGAGRRRREGRSSALRQSTVAALTSKFNALNNDSQRIVIHEDSKSKGAGRYSVVLEPRAANHPALVARISTGTTTTTTIGGVKAAIQIFEKNVVKTEPLNTHKNIKNVTSSKNIKSNSIIVTTTKGKNITNLKFDIKNNTSNDILINDVKKSLISDQKKSQIINKKFESVKIVPIPLNSNLKPVNSIENLVKEKSVPTPPKPELKPVQCTTNLDRNVPLPPKPELKPIRTVASEVKTVQKSTDKSVPLPPKPELKPTRTSQIVNDFEKNLPKRELKSAQSLSNLDTSVPLKSEQKHAYNISTLYLPLIQSPKPLVQNTTKSIKIENVKITKPEVPVKNQHIIKEFLEASENNKQNKPLISELKPNKSSLFLPLIKSTPKISSNVQINPTSSTENINKNEVHQSTESLKSSVKPTDLSPSMTDMVKELNYAFKRSKTDLTVDDDETPTQETSLVAEVLNALAENKILTPIYSKAPGFEQFKIDSEVPNTAGTPETPKVLPNTSFLWSSGVTRRDEEVIKIVIIIY